MGHTGGARTTGAEGERDIAQDIAGASRGRGREAGHNSRIMKLKSMYQYPVIFIVVCADTMLMVAGRAWRWEQQKKEAREFMVNFQDME